MIENNSNELTVIVITYNSDKYLNRCLDSIEGYQVIVIDNCSKDNTIKIAEKHKVKIIINKKNYGYAKAANIGTRNSNSDYILLINPDVYFKEDTIKKMLLFMQQHKECDIQGPKLVNDKGKLIYSCKRFPVLKDVIGRRLGLFKKSVYYYLMKDYDHKKPKIVDWVSGGCMLFKNVLKLDERFFLYLEDVDFCHKKLVYYNPNAVAFHSVQRKSAEKLIHLFYHLSSFFKYKLKHNLTPSMRSRNPLGR
jgi:N-acetylglucosaminyl-diphospho-decaprenol L-rhamnosyltransferase